MYKYIILIILACTSVNAEDKIYPIAIIGSGAGGTMAAKRAALHNREAVLFTGAKKDMKSGRGHWVRKVDNIPGFSHYTRTINQLREETLEEIAQSPYGQFLNVVQDGVEAIEKQGSLFKIQDRSGKSYFARYVIMATGIMDEQPHINGTIKPILPFANKQLVCYCILCDGHRSYMKKTAVIGYSEDAAQNALLLESRYHPPKLTLMTNGIPHTISEKTLQLLQDKGIELVEDPIAGIIGNKSERILNGFECGSGNIVEAEIAFVSLGIRPNNKLALSLGLDVDAQGLVKTTSEGEASVSNLFIVGDLRSNSMKQIYTAWQHAVEAIQVIDRRIRKEK